VDARHCVTQRSRCLIDLGGSITNDFRDADADCDEVVGTNGDA
jgi:hypothetical protein